MTFNNGHQDMGSNPAKKGVHRTVQSFDLKDT